MQPRAKKYALDILSAIAEIEFLVGECGGDYVQFQNNPLAIRSLERLLEIVGEATHKLLKSDNTIVLAHSQRIISLRNRLAHAYDSIELSILWGIALKNIPELKKDLMGL